MKKTLILSIALLLSVGASAQDFMAGAAKVDITPKESDLINKTDIIRDKIQVIGSNLQPGYAEDGIIDAFHKLYDESKK